MAFDSPYEEEAVQPPLSLHPAFPAIVALWFAALLGIGSLVLPAALLDKVVTMTGIASLIPAAAPPLGLTARSLIALVGALAGAGLGISVARRVANSHRPEPVARAASFGSRRPISVHEELGGPNGLRGVTNGESLPLGRRRALAISEDDRPSDFLYRAPMPGVDPDAPAPFAAAPFVSEAPESAAAEEEPLELLELAEEATEESPDEDLEMTDSREFRSAWPSHQHYPAGQEPVEELDSRKNLAGPRGLEPLPFAAPSLARKAATVQFELEPELEPEFEPEPELEPEIQLEAVAAVDEPEFRADWETAPLEGLGLVQLVQRLGSTIERRRERLAEIAAAPVVAPVAVGAAPFAAAPVDFEPAPAEEAAQAMAAFFAPNLPVEAPEPETHQDSDFAAPEPAQAAMPRPNFLRPLAVEDEDDGEDAVPDFSLPLRRAAAEAPSPAPVEPEQDEEDEAETDSGFSSLLGMSNPFAAPKSEFVRIEEPEVDEDMAEPAVVFPGQEDPAPNASSRLFDPPGKAGAAAAPAPQAPADADAALRAALATLQRMSGAA
jgi:hypothetical protein